MDSQNAQLAWVGIGDGILWIRRPTISEHGSQIVPISRRLPSCGTIFGSPVAIQWLEKALELTLEGMFDGKLVGRFVG